jgi:pantothenate kinase-related protein Tda10
MDIPQIDLTIFDSLLQKRPELSPVTLKEDLDRYYLPYIKKIIDLKDQKGGSEALIIGVSAIQGAGKTTQGEILEIILDHLGHSTDSRSIDDHYITHSQLCELRNTDPRFIRRGVTHDINLAMRDLKNLQQMADGNPILISGYYKGAHHGDGDRFRWVNLEAGVVLKATVREETLTVNKEAQQVRGLYLTGAAIFDQGLELPEDMGSDIPVYGHFLPDDLNGFLEQHWNKQLTISISEPDVVSFIGDYEIKVPQKSLPNAWRVVSKKPDFIFYDGWMLGVRKALDESVFNSGLPALESDEAREFAKFVNHKLAEYEQLWQMIDFLNVLYVPNYEDSLKWRDQAEEVLRAKGEGMSHDEIREFVYYFWRSVHPAIHIKNLAHDTEYTNQVIVINDDHTVREILTPFEAKVKYP